MFEFIGHLGVLACPSTGYTLSEYWLPCPSTGYLSPARKCLSAMLIYAGIIGTYDGKVDLAYMFTFTEFETIFFKNHHILRKLQPIFWLVSEYWLSGSILEVKRVQALLQAVPQVCIRSFGGSRAA